MFQRLWSPPLAALPAATTKRRCLADLVLLSAAGWNLWRWRRSAGADERPAAEHSGDARSAKLARLEAALLVADAPLSARKLAQFAALADAAEVRLLIAELNGALDRSHCAFRVESLATGYRLLTRPRFAAWLDRLHTRQAQLKLSSPMLETLAIVAYRQPVTRADIEAVRGVQSAEMLKQLMEKGLVRIVGEDDSLGRPYLYGTTRQFQERYGLNSLDDLPHADKLRKSSSPVVIAPEPAGDADDGDGPDSHAEDSEETTDADAAA